jgi:hypothetical protein
MALPMSALQDVCLNRMSPVPDATDAALTAAFVDIPALLERTPALIARGRFLDCECRLGPLDQPFHVSIRASAAAWAEHWKPAPRPGWHDLLALTKRGEAVLEGDLHPFMAHLQYFKDLLALPRHHFAVGAS